MKILTLLVAIIVSPGQAAAPSVEGMWTARFEGQTFVRLELKTTNGTITGGMSLGKFEVDKQGALRRAVESPRDLTPIFDVTRRESTVTFSRKDGTSTDRFELQLLEAGHAELHVLLNDADRRELAASGIPAVKPIALSRQ